MNILVCIKQVPDTTIIKIDPETNTLMREGVPAIVSPFDAYALEAAARIKDKYKDTKIVVLSMGPEQALAALKECLSVGGDKAYLVSDRACGGSDTLATGYILSKAKEKVEELEGIKFEESTFFVWGAGGTGKSVCFTMADMGAKKMYISSRSEKCEILAKDLNEKFGREVAVAIRTADQEAVIKAVEESDVLVNLSGLGMRGHEDETVIDKKYIKSNQVCFDATYNPLKTRFLQEAEEQGCKIINGLGMVIYQGARQIELWTGKEAPVEQMFKTIDDITNGR